MTVISEVRNVREGSEMFVLVIGDYASSLSKDILRMAGRQRKGKRMC